MDIRTIGLILIGVILLAIMLAFIFSGSFRRDVIASEGEAAVLGLINVKGVIIVLLTAIFGGIFAYIISSEPPVVNKVAEKLDTTKAIAYLQTAEDDVYAIQSKGDSMLLSANNTIIGGLNLGSRHRLIAERQSDDPDLWNIGLEPGSYIGSVGMGIDHGTKKWQPNKSILYETGKSYKIDGVNLYFRIDTITMRADRNEFQVSFGEGKSADNIIWAGNSLSFNKSPDGIIYPLDEEPKILSPIDWKHKYYLWMGLGQPHCDTSNNQVNYPWVEKVNVVAVEAKLE